VRTEGCAQRTSTAGVFSGVKRCWALEAKHTRIGGGRLSMGLGSSGLLKVWICVVNKTTQIRGMYHRVGWVLCWCSIWVLRLCVRCLRHVNRSIL
jgi:hypothetical protein